jgi:hypothetical protein
MLEQASHATGWGLDRGDIVAVAFALRGIFERIEDVAEGLDRAPFRAVWIAPCGVVRDLTRAVDTELRGLDRPTDEADAQPARVKYLREEGRSLLRERRRTLVADAANPIDGLAAHDLIMRLERALAACLAAAAALRRTRLKHR